MKKVAESNSQLRMKRCGAHVEMIKSIKPKNSIPFLFSENKANYLSRYLEATGPDPVLNYKNNYISGGVYQEPLKEDDLSSSDIVTSDISDEATSFKITRNSEDVEEDEIRKDSMNLVKTLDTIKNISPRVEQKKQDIHLRSKSQIDR